MFKYFRVNDYSLDALSKRTVYASHFEQFNDPFECWCIRQEGAPPFSLEDRRFMAASRAFGFPEGTPKVSFEMLLEALEGSEPTIQAAIDAARIACFSSRPDNLLMWSHYADGLRGFCLEFEDRAFTFERSPWELLNVAYKDEPPIFDSFLWAVAWDQAQYHASALGEVQVTGKGEGYAGAYENVLQEATLLLRDLYVNMFATKPRAWEYEHEARLIVGAAPDMPLHIPLPYPASGVRSIIIGHRATGEHVEQIRETAKLAGIEAPIRFARRDEGSYQMRFEEVPRASQ
jgi:hypothetical protein